jgi:hypothetical protein
MNEIEIKEKALAISDVSTQIVIVNQEDYAAAAEFLKQVKTSANAVKDFFKDIKEAAAKTHRGICEKEKAYLTPLNNAEIHVKGIMGNYLQEQERIRRVKEAELRRQQEEAARKAADEAARLEAEGKQDEAEAALDIAVEIAELKPVVEMASTKVEGVSYTVDYDVTVTDALQVPTYISGVELRPVDLMAVKRYVKACKGAVTIPGIKITETKNMRVRV